MSEKEITVDGVEGNFNSAESITLYGDIHPEVKALEDAEVEKTADDLVEHASGFIFVPTDSSKGLDENGEEYDYSFVTENGRVSWEKNENGDFLTNFSFFVNGNVESEKRIMNSDELKNWFYSPTTKYYQENVVNVPIQ